MQCTIVCDRRAKLTSVSFHYYIVNFTVTSSNSNGKPIVISATLVENVACQNMSAICTLPALKIKGKSIQGTDCTGIPK